MRGVVCFFVVALLPACSDSSFDVGSSNDSGTIGDSFVGGETAIDSPVADAPSEAPCGDTLTDPRNCGRCGHDCLGGLCDAGRCQPLSLLTDSPYITGLVAYPAGTMTRAIWSIGTATGALQSCTFGDKTKCSATQLVDSFMPRGLVGNDALLLWFDLDPAAPSVSEIQVACGGACTRKALARTDRPIDGGGMAVGASDVFWTDDGFGPAGHLSGFGIAPGTLTTLVSGGDSYFTSIAIGDSGNHVFYVDGLTIKTCPASPTSCVPTAVVNLAGKKVANPPTEMAIHRDKLYWTSLNDHAVARCDPLSCAGSLTILAKGISAPVGLAVDDDGVFFTDAGTTDDAACATATGAVYACPLDGCTGDPTKLAEADHCAKYLAVAGKTIVFASSGGSGSTTGAIGAVAKP